MALSDPQVFFRVTSKHRVKSPSEKSCVIPKLHKYSLPLCHACVLLFWTLVISANVKGKSYTTQHIIDFNRINHQVDLIKVYFLLGAMPSCNVLRTYFWLRTQGLLLERRGGPYAVPGVKSKSALCKASIL